MNDYDRQPEDYDTPDESYEQVNEPQPEPFLTPQSSVTPSGVGPTSVFCIQCGYNLTGIAIGSCCPECGRLVAPSFHGQTLPTSGKAIASMVLGICSIVGCMFYAIPTIICAPLAIIFSILARKQVERGEAGTSSSGMAIAGMVCGLIGIALVLLMIGFVVVVIITNR